METETNIKKTVTSEIQEKKSHTLRIESLSSEVVDQIAAGEVVERPSHLVKELIENSLDAGASEITLEFSEGGRDVLVVDNGCGIHPEDLKKALDRHATSKIHVSEDIWNLRTFGFRGEALASIASVSKMTLSSKILEEEYGSKIESEFGKISNIYQIGHAQGTQIHVQNLFENVPARLKFLRSQAAESTQIKNVVKALALSNHNVSFKVLQGAELIYYWPRVETKRLRAQQVLGIDKLYEGSAQRDRVTAYAVFTDPSTTVKTSRQIWIFAQNRWIQDRSLQSAVMESYRNLLMHGEFPIAAVWVETDPDQIDVNIHPTKSQVKFIDPSVAFRAVHACLRDTLETAPWVESLMKSTEGAVLEYSQKNLDFSQRNSRVHSEYHVSEAQTDAQSSTFENSTNKNFVFSNLKFQDSVLDKTQYQVKKLNTLSEVKAQPDTKSSNLKNEIGAWGRLQVLSQAGLTYIVCQGPEGLIFVDQHAAHERVLFEKFMSMWNQGKIEIQDFLFPIALDLRADQVEILMNYKNEFKKLGIEIEMLGPETLGIKSAPLLIKDSAFGKAFDMASQEMLDHGGSFVFEKIVGDLCASMACHSAVRAGQSLSPEESKSLLLSMDEYPLSSFCPHGRPVSVSYSFYQLEKDFGRLV